MAIAVVTVRWGDTVLVCREVAKGARASIGVGADSLAPVPCEGLGAARVDVAASRGSVPVALVPEGAVAFHERPGAIPAPVCGPAEVTLGAGEKVSYPVGAFFVTVVAAEAETPPWKGRPRFRAAAAPGAYAGIAAAVHALVLGISAQSARAASFEADPAVEDLSRYLAAAEARSAANEAVVRGDEGKARAQFVDGRDGNGGATGGARAAGKEGRMGGTDNHAGGAARYSIAADGKGSTAATRADAIADAKSFGMIGVLTADAASRAPWASFGEVASRGEDTLGARGDLWGTSIGETFGAGGLALSGIGESGGGPGAGIGLGYIGTVGHGIGLGFGTGGQGSGPIGPWRSWPDEWVHGPCRGYAHPCLRPRDPGVVVTIGTPTVRALKADGVVAGPDAYNRSARAAYSALRKCYDPIVKFSAANDRLEGVSGTVVTSLVVDANGAVLTAGNASSSFDSPEIALCSANAFRGLQFPVGHDGGSAGVRIPVRFTWRSMPKTD